jgi:hypothetical protein
MSLTLKEQIAAISRVAREQGKSEYFMARAMIFWLEWHLNLSLAGNGFLDDDEDTLKAVAQDETQIQEFKTLLVTAGVIGWYNRNLV